MTQTTDIGPYVGERPSFNPHEHIMKLKSKEGAKDYLPVQWRLVWFREQCPQGTIDTEEIVVDLDRECEAEVYVWNQDTKRSEKTLKRAPGYARYRAIVTDGKGGRATGTKTERGVDFPDFVEKAETGAIGRALAALGYGTQFAPELDEQERIVDAPTTVTQQQSTRPYNERRPFVEADKFVKNDKSDGQALHDLGKAESDEQHEANGHQEPERIPLTLDDVKWRAKDMGIAQSRKDWQFFNAETFGAFVPDEKLKGDQKRLAQLNEAITAKASAGAGK